MNKNDEAMLRIRKTKTKLLLPEKGVIYRALMARSKEIKESLATDRRAYSVDRSTGDVQVVRRDDDPAE